MNKPQVIAHRGASLIAPENTKTAFDLALRQGADGIELDVQMTQDGELVVWHDDTLDRTARRDGVIRSGDIGDMVFDDVALCDVGSWFNHTHGPHASESYVGLCAMRLEEVLDLYGNQTRLFIELKRPERHEGMVDAVARLLHGRAPHRHRVLCVDAHSLIRLHVIAPELALMQLLPHRGQWPLTLKEISGYATAVGPIRSMIGDCLIATARTHDLEVFPYTVNEGKEVETMIRRGVAGVITDSPDVAVATIAKIVGSSPDLVPV
jgi:glycerophosphoryl diester phosphodiesterase